jgi:hypothetical protein
MNPSAAKPFTPTKAIGRRIIALSCLLLAAIIGNASFSTYKEYRKAEASITNELNNRLRIALSIKETQIEKLAIV